MIEPWGTAAINQYLKVIGVLGIRPAGLLHRYVSFRSVAKCM